jgi:hypothetical protein
MDGMARSCGVDSPDAEGEPHSHADILQNDGGSVKPRGADHAASETSENSGICEKRRPVRHAGQSISQAHRVLPVSFFTPFSLFPLSADGAAMVKRIAPIRLISLICSPT